MLITRQLFIDQMDRPIIDKVYKFRFIGSKADLLKYIDQFIRENIKYKKGEKFADIFAGSGVVGRYFKNIFTIIANDNLYFSYVMQQALIVMNKEPCFQNIQSINIKSNNCFKRTLELLYHLENLEGIEGFIYKNFSPASFFYTEEKIKRKFFSVANAKKIDAIRNMIEILYSKEEITKNEYFYLITSLLFAVQKIANISGTYGAFNKHWDNRALKPIKLPYIKIYTSHFKHKAYNCDVFEFLKKNMQEFDIVYIDPPYNSRQYISNYHVLETIAKYDDPILLGKTGVRYDRDKYFSPFCYKQKVYSSFLNLLSNLITKYIIISYSSDGILQLEELKELLKQANYRVVDIKRITYRRFKSNSFGQNSDLLIEYLILGERK